MTSVLDGILAKPAMYCGQSLASIDAFSLFFAGLSLGLMVNRHLTSADSNAIMAFGRFMRQHLHGSDKNCHWEYDLLAKTGSHGAAVGAASALLLHFRDRLSAKGVDRIDDVLREADKVTVYLGDDGKYHVAPIAPAGGTRK